MEVKLFGLTLGKDKKKQPGYGLTDKKARRSFVPPRSDDDSINIETLGGGFFGHYLDTDPTARSDNELIYKYREMSMHPECESAIEDVVGEAIVSEDNQTPVKILLDKIEYSGGIKKKIATEFDNIMKLLEFQTKGYEIFRRWFIDGKIYYHIIVDEKTPKNGIAELRYVDAVNIQKIREFKKENGPAGSRIVTSVQEYYVYNKDGFKANAAQGLKISPDAVASVNSGLFDARNKRSVSYLHKAIKPMNQLRMMEDAVVIYRLCLVGDTRVKTNNGWKYIKDVQPGDTVYSFNTDGLFQTGVKNAWSNGVKDVYRVRSTHHEIVGTDNHPILVYSSETGEVSYVDIKDLDPEVHYFVYERPESIKTPTTTVDPVFAEAITTSDYKSEKSIQYFTSVLDKPVPDWVWGSVDSAKAAFVVGVGEVGGFTKTEKDSWTCSLALPNKKLVEDIKELWTSLGFASGNIFYRKNDGWSLCLTSDSLQHFEPIVSVEYYGREEVFDIEVESDKHNFVANGVLVHNSRAPERRVFYVDVGSLPKNKAEQYVRDLMNRHRNKLVYDATTGEVRDDRRHLSMLEDYWMPRREGSQGTKIETLPGACLDMDTKVSLLDGRELSIRDIAKETSEGKELWTKSCHPVTGEVADGIISWAGVTQESAKVLRLHLSNNTNIVCTPDHKFPLLGIGFKRADQLVVGQSMIPEHTVVEIEYLDEPRQVGTLTIDNDEVYHNYHTFALSCGVFTKNSNLSNLEDVKYFQKKLYKSMNVPIGRLDGEQKSFTIGKSTEITRDEIKFAKFISRLRNKFAELFYQLLKTQLVLKGIIEEAEWDTIKNEIFFDFLKDSYFAELKNNEILNERVAVMAAVEPYIGRFYSEYWVQKNVLGMNDEEINKEKTTIADEKKIKLKETDEQNKEYEKRGMLPIDANGAPYDPLANLLQQKTTQKQIEELDNPPPEQPQVDEFGNPVEQDPNAVPSENKAKVPPQFKKAKKPRI